MCENNDKSKGLKQIINWFHKLFSKKKKQNDYSGDFYNIYQQVEEDMKKATEITTKIQKESDSEELKRWKRK